MWRGIDLIESRKYSQLKRFKDMHKGERCFIVCTGPSLRLDDLDKLNNEKCFSMNSVVKLFDKTSWRPTYYTTNGDRDLIESVEKAAQSGDLRTIFAMRDILVKHKINPNIAYCYPVINSMMIFNRKVFLGADPSNIGKRVFEFSDNLYRGVSIGGSATNLFIQVAVYMGFTEIYLLGCDCNYTGQKKYHPDLDYSRSGQEPVDAPVRLMKKMLIGYTRAKEYTDKHGIKIYNATRGGSLEVFDRVDLDEVLGNS